MKRSVIALALFAAPAFAQASAPFTVNGQGFATLQEAVSSVRMGTATILIAPGTYRQCAVQAGGRITFKAVQPGTAIFEGVACEDKAALVLRGQGSVVDGLVFRGYRVSDGNGAGIEIPAKLDDKKASEVREMAKAVFQTLGCEGLSRVDLFMKKDGTLLVNEINTLPGFTKISMYPKMMGATGVAYSDLIDRLINLAIVRTKEERALKK